MDSVQASLTDHQRTLLIEYQEKWLDIATSTQPADRQRAETAVLQAYQDSRLDPPKKLIWCDSPGEAVRKIHAALFRPEKLGKNVRPELVGRKLGSIRFSPIPGVSTEMRNEVIWALMHSLKPGWEHHRDGLMAPSKLVLENLVKVVTTLANGHNMAFFEGQLNVSNLAKYDFIRQELATGKELYWVEPLVDLAQSCGPVFFYENVCYLCERISGVFYDVEGRYHRDGEAAITYPDGWGLYYWKGTPMPEKYGTVASSDWKTAWLAREDNAELRQVLIEGMGYQRIINELNAEIVDTWKEYELLSIKELGDDFHWDEKLQQVVNHPMTLLARNCPTTHSTYCLRVPHELTGAREAVAWTNRGVDKDTFERET